MQAWAASYASSQKPSEHCARHNPGAASTPAAAAAAKRNTTSVVMTLPSPSKLRSASSRSALLGKRSSESTSKNNSDPPPVPPASPPRWRRDRFQVRGTHLCLACVSKSGIVLACLFLTFFPVANVGRWTRRPLQRGLSLALSTPGRRSGHAFRVACRPEVTPRTPLGVHARAVGLSG